MEPLTILIVLAMIATVAALAGGVVSMGRGGDYDRAHGTQFMFARVGLQGIALVLMALALLVA